MLQELRMQATSLSILVASKRFSDAWALLDDTVQQVADHPACLSRWQVQCAVEEAGRFLTDDIGLGLDGLRLPGFEIVRLSNGDHSTYLMRRSRQQPMNKIVLASAIWSSDTYRALYLCYQMGTFGGCLAIDPLYFVANGLFVVISAEAALFVHGTNGVSTRGCDRSPILDRWLEGKYHG